MSRPVHNGGTPTAADIAEQRRRARRTALLLGLVALCTYVGFIVATGLRH